MTVLKKIIDNLEEYIAILLFSAMVILIFMQIVFRFVINFSLDWTEEAARYTFVFLVYLSATIAVKRRRHLRMEALHAFLPQKVDFFFFIISNFVWLCFSIAMIFIGFSMAATVFQLGQTSPVLNLSMGVVYMIVPICYLSISIRIIQCTVTDIKMKLHLAEDNSI